MSKLNLKILNNKTEVLKIKENISDNEFKIL